MSAARKVTSSDKTTKAIKTKVKAKSRSRSYSRPSNQRRSYSRGRSLNQTSELKINGAYTRRALEEKNVYAELLRHYTCGDAKLYGIFAFCRIPSKGTWDALARMFRGNADDARRIVRGINDLILRAPRLSDELVVYRGMRRKLPRRSDGVIVDMGMASTSLHRHIGVGFTEEGGYLLKITIPPNCPMLSLRNISTYEDQATDEYEIVLPFGSTFTESSPPIQVERGITQYHLTYNCTHDSDTGLSDEVIDKFKNVMSEMDIMKANARAQIAEDQARRAAEKAKKYASMKGGRRGTRTSSCRRGTRTSSCRRGTRTLRRQK